MTCGIYCIKNTLNGKIYVGQSKRIEKRWVFHKWQLNKGIHPSKELQKDWNSKKEAFSFQIIEICKESELEHKEMQWIKKLNAFTEGYNDTIGGRGIVGKARTPEHCKHLSESLKGRVSPMKGKHFSDEHKSKISKAMMGNTNTPFGGKNHSAKPVRSITTGMVFDCAADAGRYYGSKSKDTPGGTINACCNGRREFAFGQQWEYISV